MPCPALVRRSLVEAVSAAIEGGASIIQIRDKDVEGGKFVEDARQALQVSG